MARFGISARSALLAGAVFLGAPAFAQQPAPVDPDLIVVTATKRAEPLQKVPQSIVAVDGATLDKLAIQSPREFGQLAPALNFQAADEARLFNFSIRGIGTESFSVGVEPSVATIVDGVVYTRPGAVFDGLGDLERVEILSGPQGTLQGKNASAGAVSLLTRRPNRTAFEGKAEVGIASHGERRGSLTLTGPLSSTLAFRTYLYALHEDGVVTNVATGKTVNNAISRGGRAKLEWAPRAGIDWLLAADWTRRDADCCAEPIRVPAASGNVTAGFTSTPVGPDNRFVNLNTVQDGWQKNCGVSLEGNIDLGRHQLTSLTAFRQYRDFALRDRDGTNAPYTGVTAEQLFRATHPGITEADARALLDELLINPLSFACRGAVCGESNSLEKNDSVSQEVRLASPTGGAVDYVAGLFFDHTTVGRDLTIAGVRANIAGNVDPATGTVLRDTAYVLADMVTRVRTTNKALFGTVNVHADDKLTFSLGARLLHEQIDWRHRKVTGPNGDHIGSPTNVNRDGTPAPGANAGTPQYDFERRYSDTALIGKVGAQYQATPDHLLYASWAKGYKGLAVDADIFLTAAGLAAHPVAPETSHSYEVGAKTQWWGRRVTVNVAAYKTRFNGYQTTSAGTDGSGAPVLRSAGALNTRGIEGEVALRPVPRLKLGANFLFAKNEFGDLFVSPTVNLKGGRPLNAPDTKYGFNASYDLPVGAWTANLSGNYTHTSKTLFTNLADANNPASVWLRPAYGVANAAVSLTSPGGRYRVTGYVKNLFDDHYVAGLRRISGSVGGAGAVAQALPRDFDRTVGASVAASF